MNPEKLSDESLIKMYESTGEEYLYNEIIKRGIYAIKEN